MYFQLWSRLNISLLLDHCLHWYSLTTWTIAGIRGHTTIIKLVFFFIDGAHNSKGWTITHVVMVVIKASSALIFINWCPEPLDDSANWYLGPLVGSANWCLVPLNGSANWCLGPLDGSVTLMLVDDNSTSLLLDNSKMYALNEFFCDIQVSLQLQLHWVIFSICLMQSWNYFVFVLDFLKKHFKKEIISIIIFTWCWS